MSNFKFGEELRTATSRAARKCGRTLARDCGVLFSTLATFLVIAGCALLIGQAIHLADAFGLASPVVKIVLTVTENLLLIIDCYALLRRVWKHANEH